MDKYDSLGNIISYDVKEVSLDGYISKITGSVKDGFIITNTNMQRIPIPVIKKWVGGTKDAVFVKLLADNKEKKTAVLKADAKWKYTFIDLPKYDEKDGHAIIYKVVEKKIAGYDTDISGDAENGFTITNTSKGKASIPVTKKWVGKTAHKITVYLLANGKRIDKKIITEEDKWQYTFKNLAKFHDGKKIKYTIEEEKLKDYNTTIKDNGVNGYVITNTYKISTKDSSDSKNIGKTKGKYKTGDNRNLLNYGVLLGISALSLIAMALDRRRKPK